MMLAPFVILGLPVGILIDKYHVKKRTLLAIGIIIMSISTGVITFLTTKSILVWGIVLFMTRVGASITETTGEIYFFTHVKEEEAYLLSIYRDMTPVAYIIAPMLATLTFLYIPFKYLFVILALLLLAGLNYIPKLKHNHDYGLSTENK
jgi:MFS family permease